MSACDADLLPVEEARAPTLALAAPLPTEWVRLEEALGRALAADVLAQPHAATLGQLGHGRLRGAQRGSTGARCPSRLTVGETIYAGGTPQRDAPARRPARGS